MLYMAALGSTYTVYGRFPFAVVHLARLLRFPSDINHLGAFVKSALGAGSMRHYG